MGKKERQLEKRKERERKVARKKTRMRLEKQAAEKREREKALIARLREFAVAHGAEENESDPDEESPYELERFRRYLSKAAAQAGHDPDNLPEEVERELLQDWRSRWDAMLEDDPVEEAQDIMLGILEDRLEEDYEDWEATKRYQAEAARSALALDPANVDAQIILANHAFDLEEEDCATGFALLRKAVAAARETLGESFFAAHGRRLHARVEAQPFLRALESLAEHLDGENRLEELLPVLRELVDLQPPGKDYWRQRLIDAALCLGSLEDARLQADHPSLSGLPSLPWARTLLAFREGDLAAAESHLAAGLRLVPAFPARLLDEETRADTLPAREQDGSLGVSLVLGRAWHRVPGAREWLRGRVGLAGAEAARPSA